MSSPQVKIDVRWMVRKDLRDVEAIEAASNADPWGSERIVRFLRSKARIGMVAEIDRQVVGYMLYGVAEDCIKVPRIAVAPSARRCGVASAMVEKLKDKLAQQNRSAAVFTVPESATEAIAFLENRDFRSSGAIADYYADGRGAFLMRYQRTWPDWRTVNRIAGLFKGDDSGE